MSEAEVAAIRLCLRRDRPYGTETWTRQTAALLGLESSIRPRGRPRKTDLTNEIPGGNTTETT